MTAATHSDLVERLLELAVAIQQIPAPTFKERRRALFVRDLLAAEGADDVTVDASHNVFARHAGAGRGRPLIVSAHLDTVFPAREIRIQRTADRICGPGIGDNSLGVASLVGLLWMLRMARIRLNSDLWLVANTCEEGLGDLRGMKQVVERFGADNLGYLVLEGTALGQVYHRAVGVQRYRVSVSTGGGHSWSDYGQPSAVHELAAIVTRLTALPLPASPRTTMNVGTIAGGTGINVLASSSHFELDLRSEAEPALAVLVAEVRQIVAAQGRDGVDVEMRDIGRRPPGEIPADHPLVGLAVDCLAEENITATLTAGSTDANIPLSRGFPAIVLGLTTGSGAHTRAEYIDTAPVAKGMNQVFNFVTRLVGKG